VKLSKLKKLMN